MQTEEFLFAYGTLQPGKAPGEIAAVVDQFVLVGEGWVRGVLYDLGEYPGAVADALGDGRVYGRVFRVPDGALGALDLYEGYSEGFEDSLFVRRRVLVSMMDGGSVGSWVYWYNLPTDGRDIVAGGQWPKNA